MKRIDNLEQNSEAWDEFRRPNIGGSDSKNLKPLTRGAMKGLVEGTAGFWHFVAGLISQKKDAEDERERGHRLEAENLRLTNAKFKLNLTKCGVWLSDDSEYIHISPDADDGQDEPLDAFEGKSFDPNKHLNIIYFDLLAKESEGYNPYNSIPNDNQDQVVKYFSIDDKLERLYWSMYNEFIEYEELRHYTIVIERKNVEGLIAAQRANELAAVQKREEVIRFMLERVTSKK